MAETNYIQTTKDFCEIIKIVEERAAICEADIVEADKAFGDIRHYCELKYPTNVTRRTKVCKLIKQYSEQRRKAKDELETIKPLLELLKTYPRLKAEICKISNVMRATKQARHYNPRVLKELFDE